MISPPRAIVIIFVIVANALAPASVFASGGIVPELGTRKTAMGAVIGRPDDLSAIYHNPAGLTLSPGINLYVNAGVSLIDTELRMRPWPGAEAYLTQPTDAEGYYPPTAPSRAYGVIPMLVGSIGLLDDKLTVALGFYVPNAIGAAFDKDSVVRYHLIDSYYIAGTATAAAAYRLTPRLSVGLSLSLYYVTVSAKRKLFPNLGGLNLASFLGGQSDLELAGDGLAFGATVGILYYPHPKLSLGLVGITRTDFDISGDVAIIFGEGALGKGSLRGQQRSSLIQPWTFQFGFNWDVTPWLEVGAELRYYFFSQLKELRTEISGISLIDALVTPRNYHDSWNASAGVNLRPGRVDGLEIMLGAHYDYSPAPDSTVSAESPSLSHHGLHVGVRYRINPRLRLSLTYIRYFYVGRDIRTSKTTPPANFAADGGNDILTAVLEIGFASAKK